MTKMKNICQKLAVAAASGAIAFAALETLPAKAASFAVGNSTDAQFIKFSGNVTFNSLYSGYSASMGLDDLDWFQARFGTFSWDKNDLSSFSFDFDPLTIDDPPLPIPLDRATSSLYFEAKNSRGATLAFIRGPVPLVSAYFPAECPPEAPPWVKDCGSYYLSRLGRGIVHRTADDSTPAPVPEGTVIPGLALGIGWLIQKRKHLAVK